MLNTYPLIIKELLTIARGFPSKTDKQTNKQKRVLRLGKMLDDLLGTFYRTEIQPSVYPLMKFIVHYSVNITKCVLCDRRYA